MKRQPKSQLGGRINGPFPSNLGNNPEPRSSNAETAKEDATRTPTSNEVVGESREKDERGNFVDLVEGEVESIVDSEDECGDERSSEKRDGSEPARWGDRVDTRSFISEEPRHFQGSVKGGSSPVLVEYGLFQEDL